MSQLQQLKAHEEKVKKMDSGNWAQQRNVLTMSLVPWQKGIDSSAGSVVICHHQAWKKSHFWLDRLIGLC